LPTGGMILPVSDPLHPKKTVGVNHVA
jgi:hypothetical protein